MPKMLIRRLLCYPRHYATDNRILAIIFFVQFFILLPYFYWNVPWSGFFKHLNTAKRIKTFESFESERNSQRVMEAKQYFNELDSSVSLKFYDSAIINHSDLDMVVTIITTKRKISALGYLLQSSAVLDKILKNSKSSKSIFTFICNIDKEAEKHDDAVFLKSYFPFVERYGTSNPSISQLYLPNSNISYRDNTDSVPYVKETIDYIFCLNAAKTWKPKHVLVIEDDAVVHDNIFEIMEYMLKYSIGNERTGIDRKWVYLKLFYPDKWLGYAFELLTIVELIATGVVGGTLLTCVCQLLNKFHKIYSINLFLICGFIFTILSCLVVGRQNVLEIRRFLPVFYSFGPSPGCCTPVMLYPVDIIENLSLSLSQDAGKIKMKTDLALARYVRKSGIPAFHVLPNLAFHIGRITTLNKKNAPIQEFLSDFRI